VLLVEKEEHQVIAVVEVEMLLLDHLLLLVNLEVDDERSRLALFEEVGMEVVEVGIEVVEALRRLPVDPGVYDEGGVVFLA
jgi:hypothetical protein